ncbi:N-6 DNA methylase [Elioraea sp.]|uniref:N-6 DNA methylase n=1 Tax=Elioraea sp. TaxID=2185103 RepID=UPI003F72DA24
MADTSLHDALIAYADAIRKDRAANPGIAGDGTGLELLLAPRFQRLLEDALRLRFGDGATVRVLPEYRKPGVGRPDIALARAAQPARSFVELKAPDKSLRPTQLRGHDKAQFERFKALPLWGFCNFHTIHLYRRDARGEEATIVAASALDPETPAATAERLIRRSDPTSFLTIVEMLALATPPRMRTAKDVAEALAHAARLVRGITLDACREGAPEALDAVRAEFRDTLFAHAEAGGYDATDENALFANAFAQTLAFGLLLARDASGKDLDQQAYRLLPEGSYPLLRATLRALTQDEIIDLLGAGFDVMLDTVNAVDPAVLAKRADYDPILYFYEDFLETFDPVARRRHGVYFTPVPVVRFMVAATDRALREHLGTNGLLDRDVLVLDPACGTGTFLLAAASAAAERAAREMGEGAVAGELTKLAERLHGFELLVGPYTVAHTRLPR